MTTQAKITVAALPILSRACTHYFNQIVQLNKVVDLVAISIAFPEELNLSQYIDTPLYELLGLMQEENREPFLTCLYTREAGADEDYDYAMLVLKGFKARSTASGAKNWFNKGTQSEFQKEIKSFLDFADLNDFKEYFIDEDTAKDMFEEYQQAPINFLDVYISDFYYEYKDISFINLFKIVKRNSKGVTLK